MKIDSILVISYSVSTASLSGSVRVRRICQNFSRMGIDVTVVAAEINDEGIAELNGCNIIHVEDRTRDSAAKRILTRIFGMPDPFVFWAKKVSRELAKRPDWNKPSFLLVSGPPHTLAMAGLSLSEELNIPFIADFRDGLVDNHRFRWLTPLHRWAGARLERQVVSKASLVVANTDQLRRSLASRYPGFATRFHTVTNGFESVGSRREDFSAPTLAYIGSAYNGYAPRFIDRLASQLNSHLGANAQICTAGPDDWSISSKHGNWCHKGFISGDHAARIMHGADVLLLLMPPGEREPSPTVPLKAYQYLASGTFIVYIGARGETSRLLESFDGTACFGREESDTGSELIADLLTRGCAKFQRPGIENYEFGRLALRLKALIEGDDGS